MAKPRKHGIVVLVTGGRKYRDRHVIYNALDDVDKHRGIVEIVVGDATGADTIARLWAAEWGCPISVFRADWGKYGKAAGPIRNQRMLDEKKPDLCLAFPTKDGVGTWDMVNRATAAKVEVKVFDKV